MFDYTYDFEPATEGLGDFFTTVLNKIKESGKKIKEWIEKVARRIRQMTGTTTDDEVKEDSKEVEEKIGKIGENISSILEDCTTVISELFEEYQKYGKYKEKEYKDYKDTSDIVTGMANRRIRMKDGGGYKDFTDSYGRGGMNDLRKDITDKEKKAWTETQQSAAMSLKEAYGKAEKVKDDLKSLSKYGQLTKSVTEKGYAELRDIFSANGKFGSQWKQVKAAAEWSTGKIREAFNKVVSVYDVGIRATDAFGKRLTSGSFRDEKGEKIKKSDKLETMKGAKYEQGVYKAYGKTTNTIKPTDKTRADYLAGKGNESAILDRLYQMAYQDAMEDIAAREEAMEFYDSIPGAYEFVEEGYDPDFDYDLI